jgi:hypothetical protein
MTRQVAGHLESRSTTLDSTDIHTDLAGEKSTISLASQSSMTQLADIQTETIDDKTMIESDAVLPAVQSVELLLEQVDDKQTAHTELQPLLDESIDVQSEIVEHQSIVTSDAQAILIEPVNAQCETMPIVMSMNTGDELTTSKSITNLHGASVTLPDIELVQPGPLPSLSLTNDKVKKSKQATTNDKSVKTKKSSGGLCGACFGAKAAQKSKKEKISATVQAPIEQTKAIEIESKPDVATVTVPTIETLEPIVNIVELTTDETIEAAAAAAAAATTTIDEISTDVATSLVDATAILPSVQIDTFQERNFHTSIEVRETYDGNEACENISFVLL